MTLRRDLEASGQRLRSSQAEIEPAQLKRRARRSHAATRVAAVLAVLVVGAAAARIVFDQAETEVATRPLPASLPFGTPSVRNSDGNELGTITTSTASDPVTARVIDELLDDSGIASRLAAAGIAGTREERLAAISERQLIIDTSIHSDLQAVAEQAVAEGARRERADVALVSLDYRTGRINALAGPALDVRGMAGTAILPVVMLAALEAGVPADEPIPAPAQTTAQLAEHGDWTVTNFGGVDHGELTLAEAVAVSALTPWPRLVADGRLSVEDVVRTGAAVGLSDLPPNPSTLLGAADVSPLELAAAFATIANGGAHAPAHLVTRISLPDGTTLFSDDRASATTVDPVHAAAVRAAISNGDCCDGAPESSWTGRGTERHGKVGVVQDRREVWFAGSVPQLTAVVWTGSVDGSEDTRQHRDIASAETWNQFTREVAAIFGERTESPP